MVDYDGADALCFGICCIRVYISHTLNVDNCAVRVCVYNTESIQKVRLARFIQIVMKIRCVVTAWLSNCIVRHVHLVFSARTQK